MDEAREYYDKLLILGEEITAYYNALEEIDADGARESAEYQEYYGYLVEAISRENSVLNEAIRRGLLIKLKILVDKDLVNKKEPLIVLRHPYAHLFRLNDMLEILSGDKVLNYVYALKKDIGHILMAFLEQLISDLFYQDIRADLISFKYSLFYRHVDLENELVNGEEESRRIELNSLKYRNDGLYSYKYLDKAVLVQECEEGFLYLENVDDGFLYSSTGHANVVINIISILARLILCDERTMKSLYDSLMNLLESEDFSSALQDEIKRMLAILEEVQSRIEWTRK